MGAKELKFKPKKKLTIEMVPRTCWMSNVRSCVSEQTWDTIRKDCYRKAGNVCEICGGVGSRWPVECHEIWDYNDRARTQTLVNMIALCPSCHEVKHIGLAGVRGRLSIALAHLAKVNCWDRKTAEKYLREARDIWEERSDHEWALDLSFLDKLGVKYKSDRQELSDEQEET